MGDADRIIGLGVVDCVDMEACLRACQDGNASYAKALLLERQGRTSEALRIILHDNGDVGDAVRLITSASEEIVIELWETLLEVARRDSRMCSLVFLCISA